MRNDNTNSVSIVRTDTGSRRFGVVRKSSNALKSGDESRALHTLREEVRGCTMSRQRLECGASAALWLSTVQLILYW